VAFVTDHVFASDAAVGRSMIVVTVPALLLAAAVCWLSRGYYSRTAGRWHAGSEVTAMD
jgi:hypothetical protein